MTSVFKHIISSLLSTKARAFLKKNKVQVIAVTGSIGKTSTKEAIYTVLKSKYNVGRSKKSFNTTIGMSLAILQEETSGFSSPLAWLKILKRVYFEKKNAPSKMVLEMGADGPGDLKKLIRIAPPKISIITNINPVHLAEGQFGSVEDIAKEKSTLIQCLSSSGLAVVNVDNVYVAKMQTKANKLTYGVETSAMLMAREVHASQKHIQFTATYKEQSSVFLAPVIGEFQVYVLLPAIAVGLSMGMTLAECAEALKSFRLPPGRMNGIEGIQDTHIIDGSYNASPTTVSSALEMLQKFKAPRKIAALGTMNELGAITKETHLEVGRKAAQVVDLLICVGKEALTIKNGAVEVGMKEEAIYTFFDSTEAGNFLASRLTKGDLILVKGSQNLVRMERLVKIIMKNPENASQLLCRQGKVWANR